MNKETKSGKLPENFTLTAVLTGGINIIVSLTYILLSILAIVFRFNCSSGAPEEVSGAQYFWNVAYRVYFQDEECDNALPMVQLTSSYTVFVLMILTLCAAVLTLIAASTLIAVTQSDEPAQYLNMVVYGLVGVCFSSLVIDLTLASHFGIDYSLLSGQLHASSGGLGFNYERDVIRQGAFLLMAFSLKGYVFHAINIVLLILLVMYVVDYQKKLNKNEHPIHKVGVISAFDNHRRHDDWPHHTDPYPVFSRGSQLNSAFINDEEPPRTPLRREPTRSDYYSKIPNTDGSRCYGGCTHSSRHPETYRERVCTCNNRSFDRSDSWQRSQPHPNQGSRPFSYLEDTRRPVPVKPPSSPAMDPNWHRDPWPPAPPVPVPDYTPQTSRRLKSALKPGYM